MTDTSLLMELRRLLAEKEKVKRAEKAIDDQIAIPAEFWKVKEERTPDKLKIKNHINAGQVVPGCSLIPTYSLQTR
ncbi:siphovirus Gp157 family protein [Mailhella sp.]|uniref:siphovirus Gp157 family protein n=1 Tax=Mailhella sp. TaxID=1981029 RepID=UPI003AB24662